MDVVKANVLMWSAVDQMFLRWRTEYTRIFKNLYKSTESLEGIYSSYIWVEGKWVCLILGYLLIFIFQFVLDEHVLLSQ